MMYQIPKAEFVFFCEDAIMASSPPVSIDPVQPGGGTPSTPGGSESGGFGGGDEEDYEDLPVDPFV